MSGRMSINACGMNSFNLSTVWGFLNPCFVLCLKIISSTCKTKEVMNYKYKCHDLISTAYLPLANLVFRGPSTKVNLDLK